MSVDYRDRVQQPRARAGASGNLRPLGARRRGLSRADEGGGERRARPRLRPEPAPDRRPVLSRRHRPHAARAVHPWRLLALARSLDLQPHVGRPECARRRGRGRGLRSLPAGDDRADRRPDPHRLPVPVAPLRPAPDGVRPFGRRASRRLHGGDRLEAARPEGAGRSRAGRLFDLRPVRPEAADRDRR